jgi:carboxysome shell carbonic anhydrase
LRPRAANAPASARSSGSDHPLTDAGANTRLYAYESSVRQAFERIVPVLKDIASHRCEPDFTPRAQAIARAELGMQIPDRLLDDAWVTGLDMRRLFAWVLFETYRQVSDEFFADDPLGGRRGDEFQSFLLDCGFHLMDVTPCADGRLAHAISYVLRLPCGAVRRKSYAGALFDIEATVEKWTETELRRFREGQPNTADAPTRYLKAVLYHFSSADPGHQGCAAHGSDDAAAAHAGWERLSAFRQAVENGFCCGASVDLLLMGVDTDTDAIRVHVPDAGGYCDLDHWLDAAKVYEVTRGMQAAAARERIAELVRAHAPGKAARTEDGGPADGMVSLIARLIESNISQIDYVRRYHGGHYGDVGHAERFIGVGVGFEEIQLRNLTYFAYLDTVEEGAADLDVGIRIFGGLNVNHGIPVPIVVRYEYQGGIPGARERAVAHCERISRALAARYPKLQSDGLLHCLRVVRDCDGSAPIELVGSSLDPVMPGAH